MLTRIRMSVIVSAIFFLIFVSDFSKSAHAEQSQDEQSQDSLFRQGLAAREVWESWFDKLTGDTRAGAEYWAGQRSLANPAPCRSAAGDGGQSFVAGCEEAKQRLTPLDVHRKSEPAFRIGWNSLAPNSSPKTAPDTAAASASAPWYFASGSQGKCTRVSDVFPKAGDNYPSTPEGIIAGTGGGSAYSLDRPSYGPNGPEHHAPGPVVRLSDILGRYPTLALVQGEVSCREALALMAKAGTSGSAEQRWAAKNAAREAQWHVVFWNGSKVPCIPLSEFVPNAMSLEQALDIIRMNDPDAYLIQTQMVGQWERIIRTKGHNLRLVQTKMYCRVWFSLVR